VWVDVWVEILSQVEGSSQKVSTSPFGTATGRTPSPFILEADLFQFRTLEYCGHVEAILVVSHTDDLLVVLISLGLAFLKV